MLALILFLEIVKKKKPQLIPTKKKKTKPHKIPRSFLQKPLSACRDLEPGSDAHTQVCIYRRYPCIYLRTWTQEAMAEGYGLPTGSVQFLSSCVNVQHAKDTSKGCLGGSS